MKDVDNVEDLTDKIFEEGEIEKSSCYNETIFRFLSTLYCDFYTRAASIFSFHEISAASNEGFHSRNYGILSRVP